MHVRRPVLRNGTQPSQRDILLEKCFIFQARAKLVSILCTESSITTYQKPKLAWIKKGTTPSKWTSLCTFPQQLPFHGSEEVNVMITPTSIAWFHSVWHRLCTFLGARFSFHAVLYFVHYTWTLSFAATRCISTCTLNSTPFVGVCLGLCSLEVKQKLSRLECVKSVLRFCYNSVTEKILYRITKLLFSVWLTIPLF